MLLAICGGFLLLSGILFALDTIVWKIESGENFIEYGMWYAASRHQFFAAELILGIAIAFIGLIIVIISLHKKNHKK